MRVLSFLLIIFLSSYLAFSADSAADTSDSSTSDSSTQTDEDAPPAADPPAADPPAAPAAPVKPKKYQRYLANADCAGEIDGDRMMANLPAAADVDTCFDSADFLGTCVNYFIFNEKTGGCTCLTGDGGCDFVDGNLGGASVFALKGSSAGSDSDVSTPMMGSTATNQAPDETKDYSDEYDLYKSKTKCLVNHDGSTLMWRLPDAATANECYVNTLKSYACGDWFVTSDGAGGPECYCSFARENDDCVPLHSTPTDLNIYYSGDNPRYSKSKSHGKDSNVPDMTDYIGEGMTGLGQQYYSFLGNAACEEGEAANPDVWMVANLATVDQCFHNIKGHEACGKYFVYGEGDKNCWCSLALDPTTMSKKEEKCILKSSADQSVYMLNPTNFDPSGPGSLPQTRPGHNHHHSHSTVNFLPNRERERESEGETSNYLPTYPGVSLKKIHQDSQSKTTQQPYLLYGSLGLVSFILGISMVFVYTHCQKRRTLDDPYYHIHLDPTLQQTV